MASPLSWTSFAGVRNVKQPAFADRVNELLLQYPSTDIAKQSVAGHVADVKEFVAGIIAAKERGTDLSNVAPLAAPPFPEAGKSSEVKSDTIPTWDEALELWEERGTRHGKLVPRTQKDLSNKSGGYTRKFIGVVALVVALYCIWGKPQIANTLFQGLPSVLGKDL